MRTLALLVGPLLAGTMLLGGCGAKWQTNHRLVKPGMSQAEVEELLGEPSSRVRVPALGGRPVLMRWQWGDSLSTLATGRLYPDSIPERVLAVGFDEEAKVEFVRAPQPPWPGSN